VVAAATRVFAERGYRRTQMADVAGELELSPAALYQAVESKEALFHLVIEGALGEPAPDPAQLPIRTPEPGATLRLLQARLGRGTALPRLAAALDSEPHDVEGELREIVEERYKVVGSRWRLLAVLEQSALDLPELADLFYRRTRRGMTTRLARYLERRIESGHLRPVPDVVTAARFVEESVAWFAYHRHTDPDSAMIDDDAARRTCVDLCVAALVRP
jgi:AcrR family transcriptional regulator